MSKSVKELHEKRNKMWDAVIDNPIQYIDPETVVLSKTYTEQSEIVKSDVR